MDIFEFYFNRFDFVLFEISLKLIVGRNIPTMKMEQKANTMITDYINVFKTQILEKAGNRDFADFIKNYPLLSFNKNDFTKRKRQKTKVPLFNRCIAKKAGGEQCTRRKKDNLDFCGTHSKGQPYGTVQTTETNNYENVTVHTREIKGIIYYMDEVENIYHPKDIIERKMNPRIISKYTQNADGTYTIHK